MIDRGDCNVWVLTARAGTPIIRRDTNTVVVELSDDEVLTLIADLAREANAGTSVYLVIEKDEIHAREVFE